MRAEEAKAIAYNFNTSEANSEYNLIQKRIKEAAEKGKYSIYLAQEPKFDVKKKLELEGYKIDSYYDQRDSSSSVTLSWT